MKSIINHRILSSAALFLFAASGIVSAQVSKSYEQITAEHPGWIQIPGRLIRPDCVHQVPSGAQIEFGSDGNPTGDVKMNGKLIAHYDSCPEESIDTRFMGSHHGNSPDPSGYGDGWIEASQWELSLASTDNIDELYGYWHVPQPPAAGGALVFWFNGLEPAGGGWIMQPVLQWGDNGDFGGDYYTFASWLVGPESTGYAVYSSPNAVNPGDYLMGSNVQNGVYENTLSYFVNADDTTTNQASILDLTSQGLHWVWGFAGVLEAYGVSSCSQFPPNDVSHFYQTAIAHGFPAYDFYGKQRFNGSEYDYNGSGGPQCNFSVSISGTTSALNY
jgi:hypothetical protein